MQKKIKDSLLNTLIMCNLKVLKLKNNTSPFGCTRLSFMSTKITKTGITSNKISGRGGLALFLRYIEKIGLYGLITGNNSSLYFREQNKGLQLQQFIKQIFAFFIDGTNMAISSFDQSKMDEGYASLLESRSRIPRSSTSGLASTIKIIYGSKIPRSTAPRSFNARPIKWLLLTRSNAFFWKLSCIPGSVFNKILNELFIWRLHISSRCE